VQIFAAEFSGTTVLSLQLLDNPGFSDPDECWHHEAVCINPIVSECLNNVDGQANVLKSDGPAEQSESAHSKVPKKKKKPHRTTGSEDAKEKPRQ
jgi:hypothetical protein